jgi:hypothetical protein
MGTSDFDTMPIPFFRGELCTVNEMTAGAPLPTRITPLLHDCLAVSRSEIRHVFTCTGSRCQAYSVVWVEASGSGCPSNVFGEFPMEEGNMDTAIDKSIAGLKDSTGAPLVGLLSLELPYLTNDDLVPIADYTGSEVGELITMAAEKYPPVDGRKTVINMSADGPMPPENCVDKSLCTCINIGL